MKILVPYFIYIVITVGGYLVFGQVNATAAITGQQSVNPVTDLVYLGAFLLPEDNSNGTTWDY